MAMTRATAVRRHQSAKTARERALATAGLSLWRTSHDTPDYTAIDFVDGSIPIRLVVDDDGVHVIRFNNWIAQVVEYQVRVDAHAPAGVLSGVLAGCV